MTTQQSYIHHDANTILSDTKAILCSSDKGKAYWENNKAKIVILKGPLPQAFVYQTSIIYLRVPALQRKGRVEQALDLAGAFIELKMNIAHKPPLENLDSDDVLAAQHMKNVEIMMKAFGVAEELDASGYNAIKEIRLMGIGKIYQAWKTGADLESCANMYWNIFDKEASEEHEGSEGLKDDDT